MQPSFRQPRRIAQPLRPERPLDYRRLSDPILVKRAKDGDPQALAALVERHAPRVERLTRHLLGDGEDARDAAQEALVKLCQRLRQFRGESQLGTWLHRLVVNTCRDVVERQRLRCCEELEEDARPSPEGDPVRAVALAELRAELGASLARLPRRQAEVVVLKDAFELSFDEIAQARDLPVGTAKCYAHRARERLRARLAGLERAVG